jgi:hypothetical protein
MLLIERINLMSLPLVCVILMVLAISIYFAFRPRILHWGATPAEIDRPLAGDELIADPILVCTRAITIEVGPQRVWPWLAQIGQGRGGFYSYEWIENLAGLDIHNADRILLELQDLKPGDLIPFWRGAGVNVMQVEPGRVLVLAGTLTQPKGEVAEGGDVGGTWVFVLDAPKDNETRLVVRSQIARFPPVWLSALFMRLLEPMHFIMERKMLLGVKERAERG